VKISKQARRDAKQLFQSCRVNGLLDEAKVRQAVTQVIAQKPRGYISVLSHFQRLLKLDLDRRSARIESAIETPPALAEDLKANLSRRYGPGLQFEFATNAALIGGLRVKVGCDVFDGSVRARLAALEESL
jgi:F-type H+-transporting ATPase subunit delta